jgi:fibronectin type 3 domain-containing protein
VPRAAIAVVIAALGSYAEISAAPLPSPPQDLTAQTLSATEIALSWSDPPGKEGSYTVERSALPPSPFVPIAVVSGQSTSFSDSGLTPGTTYCYRVCATNKKGDSLYSDTVCATTVQVAPAAPASLGASAVSSSQIDLSWVDNSNNESGFKISRSLWARIGFAQIATVGANVTSYSSAGLAADTTYYYRARAYNSAGNSAYSNTASARTTQVDPVAPSGLNAVQASSSRIDLSWADNSNNESGFSISRSLWATSGFAQIASVGANVTSYSSTGLAADTTYYYRVRPLLPLLRWLPRRRLG